MSGKAPHPIELPQHQPERWERLGREMEGEPIPCDGCGDRVSWGWMRMADDRWLCQGCYEKGGR